MPTIAGSDPSAGAGIQADLKAIEACGAYAATAITAITVRRQLRHTLRQAMIRSFPILVYLPIFSVVRVLWHASYDRTLPPGCPAPAQAG